MLPIIAPMPNNSNNPHAVIPSVDRIVNLPALSEAIMEHGQNAVTDAVRTVLSDLRRRLSAAPDASRATAIGTLIQYRTNGKIERKMSTRGGDRVGIIAGAEVGEGHLGHPGDTNASHQRFARFAVVVGDRLASGS